MKKISALLLALTMIVGLCACGGGTPAASASPETSADAAASPATSTVPSGVEDGVLTVAMECAYAPYNWTQADDSNGAVPIKDSNEFANGYDVMMAKKLCEANGWQLEIVRLDWESLIPAVQTGLVDAVIAGQSMTPERMEQVDFAGPYLYATIVCLTLKDSSFASAKGISDLAGGKATSQIGTIWYDTCLPQIKAADIQPAAETAPAMLMALETKTVDFVCTDMPTAQGALAAYPDMTILNFAGSDDDFAVSDSDVNIGISIMKGNTVLLDALNGVLSGMSADDFNTIMADAIAVQPITNG
ncbi:MAG: transporter substrate-binding domain-containing protein [Oscillospiraceae bacterium]|nr:transporter substrate-binding domain-containing protein [Oscillospiraceae bacterium]